MKQNKPYRRANGTGSVYKLSGRRRKPWIARITTSIKDGKQHYQTIGYFETETEANQALLMNKINPVSPRANITLEKLYEEWSKVKYEEISKSTVDNYKAAWKYLSDYRNVIFKELRSAHFKSIINKNKNLSTSSLTKIKALATQLYAYAMENDIVKTNYAEFVKIPKKTKDEKETFTDTEVKIMEKNSNIEWIDTILILIYTGMRVGELLTLTKFNIDIKNQIITGGIKTDAGKNRPIPIHPKILPFIKKWLDKEGDALICRNENKINIKYYREKLYYPALEKIEIKKRVPHACRHTFASKMAKAKVNTKYIQELIGHSDYSFTANNYTHVETEELRKAINMI